MAFWREPAASAFRLSRHTSTFMLRARRREAHDARALNGGSSRSLRSAVASCAGASQCRKCSAPGKRHNEQFSSSSSPAPSK